MRRLKVYGLTCFVPGHVQARCIIAARSQKEAARLLGTQLNHLRTNGSETWNKEEVATAMASPGTVFWRPLDDRGEWRVRA